MCINTFYFPFGILVTALPLTAFGTDKFGCRPLVMFGGFALFLGYLLSSLATGIGVVMLAQGVIGGNTCI